MKLSQILKYFAPAILLLAGLLFTFLPSTETGRVRIVEPTVTFPGTKPIAPRTPAPICIDPFAYVCSTDDHPLHDPTGSVISDSAAERAVFEIYEQTLLESPDAAPALVEDLAIKKIYSPKRAHRFKTAFSAVRKALGSWIEKQPPTILSRREKILLLQRLMKVKLEIPPPASLYADTPDVINKSEIFYLRLPDGQTRLRVGGAYLIAAGSWFNLFFSIAHELAHSIDPCELRAARPRTAVPAFDRLVACFFKSNWVESSKLRAECISNDQVSETFADWVAVQITTRELTRYLREFDPETMSRSASNAVRDLCDEPDSDLEADISLHPSAQKRIAQIFLENPEVRDLLGCGQNILLKNTYCELKHER